MCYSNPLKRCVGPLGIPDMVGGAQTSVSIVTGIVLRPRSGHDSRYLRTNPSEN